VKQITILGAEYRSEHFFLRGHDRCVIYEAKPRYGGHIFSFCPRRFYLGEGPHVLYTDNEYVKQLFADGVDGEYEECDPQDH